MALTFNTTTRRALRWLTGSNLVSDIDAGFQALAEDVDAQLLVRSFGKSIVATTESRVNTAYGLMPTPDKVNVVLPTDGLICVLYQATWRESAAGTARAAIFVGANQAALAAADSGSPAPGIVAAATTSNSNNVDVPLASFSAGLCSTGTPSVSGYTGDATTGQIVGVAGVNGIGYELNGTTHALASYAPGSGRCYIFAAAGTYDVSVQFKATSGTVTAKNRKLWVSSMF